MPWEIVIEDSWPDDDGIPHRLAIDVDPRRRTVHVGPRVVGSTSLDIQSGAVARSFYEGAGSEARTDLTAAGDWLHGPEAAELLAILEGGFHCDVLWTGDPVVTWTEAAWQAGHALIQAVGTRIGTSD